MLPSLSMCVTSSSAIKSVKLCAWKMAMQPMSVLSPGEFPQASDDCVRPSAAADHAQSVVSMGWSTTRNCEKSVVSTMVVAVADTGPWQYLR